jgi:hypothetical protein
MRFNQRVCTVVAAAIICGFVFVGRPASAQTQIQAGQVIISEFRLRGPAGAEDEFIELYNNTNQPITVQALDTTGGWTVAISNGQITGPIFTIPNGTIIPARGHLLGGNANGYSLCNYPSGYGTTAPTPTPTPTASPCIQNGLNGTFTHTTPDRTWDFDVPDGSGVALFATTSGTNFTAATRLDAAGFTPSPALYKEGGGIPSVVTANTEHTYYRDLRSGLPRDTADNASDFLLVGTTPGIQVTRLGAPGPENLASPIVNNTTIVPTLLDPSVSASSPPNRARTFGMEPNGTFGTLLIRRTITNNTGQPISRLRFRVINITTFGTPASECAGGSCADVRALTSQGGPVTVSGPTVVTVLGLRLEEPPEQPAGGGYNTSLSADTITLGTPLPVGQSINVEFKLGIERTGIFRFFVNTEAQNGSAPATFNGPASSGVSVNGGTDSRKRQLIMETVEPTPRAPAAPASPAAAPSEAPRYVYAPWVINLPPAPERTRTAEDEQEKEDEGKQKKSEEAPPSAAQTPAASAPDSPATAADEPAPQSAPATTRRSSPKRLPAGAKARRGDNR